MAGTSKDYVKYRLWKEQKGGDALELMTTFALQTRLFKEPDIAAEQIATISPNTTVDLLDACNQFCRVALTDESGHRFEGYVVRNFLKPLVSAPAPTVVDNSPSFDSLLNEQLQPHYFYSHY